MPSAKHLFGASFALLLACAHATPVSSTPSPSATAQARAELLAADRAYGVAESGVFLPAKLLAAFSPNVHLLAGGQHVHGKEAAERLLASNPVNPKSTIEWTPRSGGVSADGTNGYTFGFTTQRRADGIAIAGKYVAYWIREQGVWRMAAFKRGPRASGDAPVRDFAIETVVAADVDSATAAREIAATEKAFSDDAGARGVVAAFRSAASEFAATMGGPADADFRYGPDQVAAGVGAGGDTKALSWGSDEVLVARSGDLGLSLGRIHVKPDSGVAPPPIPFFTVWRRENGRWRYLAE